MKKIFIFTMLMVLCTIAQARKLTILALRDCSSIKIGKKHLRKGDCFDSRQTIFWNNGRQLILVVDEQGHTYRLTHKGFQKHNANTPEQYFIAEQSLGTRDYTSSNDHYTRHDYYLTTQSADTLLFPVNSRMSSDMHAEAVWKDEKGNSVVTPVKLTSDHKFYIITPRIWNGRQPKDILLTIRETTTDGSWMDNVYQELHIVVP